MKEIDLLNIKRKELEKEIDEFLRIDDNDTIDDNNDNDNDNDTIDDSNKKK